MTYEKDIPDYALVPAKEPEERVLIPITQGAIYSPVQVTNITEKPKTTITIEEDILVPDTKPDLKEILMIDGKVHLANREIDQISKQIYESIVSFNDTIFSCPNPNRISCIANPLSI